MPAQQAFDSVDRLLRDCYRDWYLAIASLPQWGEEVDAQVQKYIQGVQDVALANLNWRFVLSLTLHQPRSNGHAQYLRYPSSKLQFAEISGENAQHLPANEANYGSAAA